MMLPGDLNFNTFSNNNAISIQDDVMGNISEMDEIKVFKNQELGEIIVIPTRQQTRPTICVYSGCLLSEYSHDLFPTYIDPQFNTGPLHWGITNLNEKSYTADMDFTTEDHSTLYIKLKSSGAINLSDDIFDQFSIATIDLFGVLIVSDVISKRRKQICLLQGMSFSPLMLFKQDTRQFLPKETRILRLDLLLFKKNTNVLCNLVNNVL